MLLELALRRDFLKDKVDTSLLAEVPRDPSIAASFAKDERLVPDAVDLARLSLRAEGGPAEIRFLGDTRPVAFKASASAHAALMLRSDPDGILAALDLDEDLAEAFSPFSMAPDRSMYCLLSWGFGAEAAANGSMGLGAVGELSFGLEGEAERKWAVVRRFEREAGARSMVEGTASSWAMPSHVDSLSRLPHDTWLFAEVSGGLNLAVAASVGYDFNWVKQVKAGGLEGDIGLRLKAALQAEVGLRISGRFALVVNVLNDARVRLQLVKLNVRGWSLAIDAGATAKLDGTDELLPPTLDDLVRATLGIHAGQLMGELKALVDPSTDLATIVGDEFGERISGWISELIQEVIPVGTVDEGRAQVLALLDRWEDVPGHLSSQIWAKLEEVTDGQAYLQEVRGLLSEIADPSDEEVRAFLQTQLERVDLFTSPVGTLLMELGGGRVLDALVDRGPLDEIRDEAGRVLALLDGGGLEEALVKLHAAVSERVAVDIWRERIKKADLDALDAWVEEKLSKFVGSKVNVAKLKEIQKALNGLLGDGQELYAKTRELLAREYSADLSFSYQKTRAGEALIDAEFDLNNDDARLEYLHAVRGDFDRLLTREIAGVKVNRGTLTHRVRRERHLTVSLPFVSMNEQTLNESLARFEAVDENGRRQLYYALKATDEVTSDSKTSRLVLEGSAGFGSPAVRTHVRGTLSYDYSYRLAVENLEADHLRHHIRPYVNRLLPGAFSRGASLTEWIDELDKSVERDLGRETGDFGDTLIGLDVAMPGTVCAAWFNEPADGEVPYWSLSLALQKSLKELVYYYFISDPRRYRKRLNRLMAVLVYCSIPPLVDGTRTRFRRPHWSSNLDYRDRIPKMGVALENLRSRLADLHPRMVTDPDLRFAAGQFRRDEAENIVRQVTGSAMDSGLRRLVAVEARIVEGAHEARKRMEDFKKAGATEPSEAVRHLADFGAELTAAFNSEVEFFRSDGAGRPFGTMLMVEAARALSGGQIDGEIAASLTISVLRDLDTPQSWNEMRSEFLDGVDPPSNIVAIQQRLVEVTEL